MTVGVIITVHNAGPHTIWAKLAEKLGREPTRQEAADDVRRILREAREDELDRRGITQERKQ
jgi:type IV secretory pathway ATPase VirB11/archaellum biosynthesis ATPase